MSRRMKFVGFDHTPVYAGSLPDLVTPWSKGEVREVSDDAAEYVASTFPDAFVGAPPEKAVVGVPDDKRKGLASSAR